MIKFLCLLAVVTFSVNVGAQEAGNSLFPELQKRNSISQSQTSGTNENNASGAAAQPTVIPSLFDTETPEQAAERERQVLEDALRASGVSLTQKLNRAAAQDPKPVSKAEQGFFVFKPTEIQAVMPTIQRFSFCTAQLTLSNNTEYNLKELGVILQYTPVELPHTFTNLSMGASESGAIALGGDACETLTRIPNVVVKTCKAVQLVDDNGRKKEVELTQEECQSKVKYVMP